MEEERQHGLFMVTSQDGYEQQSRNKEKSCSLVLRSADPPPVRANSTSVTETSEPSSFYMPLLLVLLLVLVLDIV